MKHQIRTRADSQTGIWEYADGKVERRMECTCGEVMVARGTHNKDPHGMELAWSYHLRDHREGLLP